MQMIDPKNEVEFSEYCKTCKFKSYPDTEEPCSECLSEPVNLYSRKPVKWEGVDTLFNKPPERRDHAAERAVREAVYLNAKDTAEAIDKQGTLAGKVHMRDLISDTIRIINGVCQYGYPEFTYGEFNDVIIKLFIDGTYKSNASSITRELTLGYTGWRIFYTPCATRFENSAFSLCRSINYGDATFFKKVTYIGDYAFFECERLGSGTNNSYEPLSLDECEAIGVGAFSGCSSLNFVKAFKLKNIPRNAFRGATHLEKIYLNKDSLETIGDSAFESCLSLYNFASSDDVNDINFNNVTSIGKNAFCMSNIKTVCFHHLETVGMGAFENCKNLRFIVLGNIKEIPGNLFYGCSSLETVTFYDDVASIGNLAFFDCYNLKEISFGSGTTVPSLGSLSLMDPNVLRSDFKIIVHNFNYKRWLNHPDWYRYRNYVYPMDYYKLKTINISCSDGGKLLSKNKDIRINDEPESFNVRMTVNPGYEISSIHADMIDVSNDVSIETVSPSITLENVDGAEYGFELGSGGYYISQNKGIDNSAAVCRIKIVTTVLMDIVIDADCSSERNYDFGILGKLDQPLKTTNIADGEYEWCTKTQSTIAKRVTYKNVTIGEHYIYVKYRKDGSTSSGEDRFRFKVSNLTDVLQKPSITKVLYRPFDTISENHDFYIKLSKKTN